MSGDRSKLWVAAQVSCYAGSRANERPVSFRVAGQEFAVLEVLESWYEPDHRYFKVRARDNGIYLLRVHEGQDLWQAGPWTARPAGTSPDAEIDEPGAGKIPPFQEADSDGE